MKPRGLGLNPMLGGRFAGRAAKGLQVLLILRFAMRPGHRLSPNPWPFRWSSWEAFCEEKVEFHSKAFSLLKEDSALKLSTGTSHSGITGGICTKKYIALHNLLMLSLAGV